MRDYTIYLKDILAAIESIEGFIAGMDLDSFQMDDKTASAVMRKLEIIGRRICIVCSSARRLLDEGGDLCFVGGG